MNARKKIFVCIASYRDTECQHTVVDLFRKAMHPERITVGICWQFDPERDQDCFAVEPPYPDQVMIAPYSPEESQGCCWARVEAHALRTDEDYVLQIDSHMRFIQGWDEEIIAMLESCPMQPAAIATMAPNYTPPDQLYDHITHGLTTTAVGMVTHPNETQPVHLITRTRPMAGVTPEMILSPFIVGGFVFSRAKTFDEVPFDPHIFFWGEEICYSVRLWTYGYNIYQPPKPVIYHNWWSKSRSEGEKAVYKTLKNQRTERSRLRMRHLLFDEPAPAEALLEMEKYGLGDKRSRDDFWLFAGIDVPKRTIGWRAKAGRWVPYKKNSDDQARIFVSIASYRDPECQHTIKDLFEKAAHPERISVGVCWQVDPEQDKDCFTVKPPYPRQVSELKFHSNESKGGCWARAQALSLMKDEEYVLQIDAHMRFVPCWDELMIDTLKRCPGKQAVLSTMVPAYTPPEVLQDCGSGVPVTYVAQLGYPHSLQPIHLSGWIRKRENIDTQGPITTPFFVGNFSFAPSRLFREVPFDPHIYFRGQEAVYSARLWTHGWDIYQPDAVLIYHYWLAKGKDPGDPQYKMHNDDAQRGKKRVWHLLELEETDDVAALADISAYGMGDKRRLADFWDFAGVDLKKSIIHEKAASGRWHPIS